MGCGPHNEIHTLHAELIHKARDIQFQIEYDNNGNPASIICIDEKNVQMALESYFSQMGIYITSIRPTGLKNNMNLEFFLPDEYIAGTLEVFLSGNRLNGDQGDPNRDYTEDSTNKRFIIELDPENPDRLNAPPLQGEQFIVNYRKRITFNTKGGD
jgi:hypothetical protein